MTGMSAPRTARARARAELTAEIKEMARRELAEQGSAGLSLRAVARELEMSSSAIYRYFASRDELLTALIIDAYDGLGDAAERAEVRVERDDFADRWFAIGRAVRRWARRNPHEYALIYGSPVPGYRAPQDTVGPASRVGVLMADLLRDAAAAGALGPVGSAGALAPKLAADIAALREWVFTGVPERYVLPAIMAWTHVFGLVNFELFGQYENVITARDQFFDHALAALAAALGLPVRPATV
jgi:AcrR family transcriptional regulator